MRYRNKGRKGRSNHRLFRFGGETSGAVSIYMAAVMAAMIFLTGTLIDFGRIAAYRKQAELSLKAGARGVLSAYDPVLYDRYGLFAIGGSEPEVLLSEVLEGYRDPEDAEALRLLDTTWRDGEAIESRPLGSHAVFKRQVLEEMKYKAPIDLTLDLASRFKGLPVLIKEARKTSDLLEDMRQAYEKREAALDRALERQAEAGDAMTEAFKGIVPRPPVPMTGGRSAGDVQDVADAALMYGDYTAKRAEDAARAEAQRQREAERLRREAEEKLKGALSSPGASPSPTPAPSEGPLYAAQIAAYELGAAKLAGQLRNKPVQAFSLLEKSLEAASKDVEEARAANQEMARIATEAGGVADTPAEWPAETGEGGFGDGEAGSLQELRRAASELVLADDYWERYGEELEAIRSAGIGLRDAAASMAGSLDLAPGSSGMDGALRDGTDRLQSQLAGFAGKHGSSGSVTDGRRETLKFERADEEERKSLEKKSRAAWSGATAFLATLAGIRSSPEEKQAFERLDWLYRRNLTWNEGQEEAAATQQPSDAEEGRKSAFASADGWLDALGDGVTGMRDTVYFAEYAYARFSMAEPSEVRAMLEGSGESLLMPSEQENEYVLYGLRNPSGNIAAAYGELFALRLAIRTMEGLIECRSYGHPLVVLAAAAFYGITEALKDVQELLDRGVITLSKYAKIDTYYKDYIRLFLLLHGSSDAQTSRRIALIEDTLDVDLQEAYTYVSARGVASVRLWFLPGAAKLAGKSVSWRGTVKGNRYETAFSSDSAYQ
ncbi:TadE/TadG family type IV pilus assembly protein [Cohnella sp. GCM10020058]|uniref:TadE/TadG family type IV pilus assembly protein n=1 Tax=Cohnella sp. GCM10020058 TaxID=3317330 RepID=UPI0036407FD8